MSISACVGASVLAPPIDFDDTGSGIAQAPAMLTSPEILSESMPSTFSLETEAFSSSFDGSPIAARILPASRLLVVALDGSDVPVVEDSASAGRSYHLPSIWIHDLPPP